MQRAGGGYRGNTRGRGRGRGFGYGGGRGGMQRVEHVNGVPPPPATPLSDPFVLPFPRLMPKNDRGSMTLDEELLRAIISQYTVVGTGVLDFNKILEKLRSDHPELVAALYDSAPHLWSYIRCYPEQFGVDLDPRYPWNVWYLAKCKIVAKADRHRYQREFSAGAIRPVPDPDRVMNSTRYEVNLEKRAVIYFVALFDQAIRMGAGYGGHLDIKNVATAFRPPFGVPMDLCTYVGEVDDFLSKRNYFCNMFGNQVKLRQEAYMKAIRKLTTLLKQNGQPFNSSRGLRMTSRLPEFYEGFRDERYFNDSDYQAIEIGEHFTFDDFLYFLFQHKLLFRIYTRENIVELRHDVLPDVNMDDARAIPPYTGLAGVFAKEAAKYREPIASGEHLVPPGAGTESPSEDEDDNYDILDDGLPYGTMVAVPPQVPRPEDYAPLANRDRSGQNATGLTLATDPFRSHQQTLTCLGLFNSASQNANQSTGHHIADQQENATGGAAEAANIEPAPPRRPLLRGGARPPRCSVRCRPAPETGRQATQVATGAISTINWPPGSGATASFRRVLEDEIDD